MITTWTLAWAMLLAPMEPVYIAIIPYDGLTSRTLKSIAQAQEWVSPTFSVDPSTWPWALNELRRLRRDLEDCPRVSEADRFPGPEAARRGWSQARDWVAYAEDHVQISASDNAVSGWEDGLTEGRYLASLWNELDNVHTIHFSIEGRRRALRRMRDLMGPAAFYAGVMPPPVPLWRFRSLH